MGRYGAFRYGSGLLYGFQGRPETSTLLLAQSLDYGRVRVTAYSEANVGTGYVLVRSNNGPAESPDDGVVIASGVLNSSQLVVTDGVENYLDGTTSNDVSVPSGEVFYTFFIFSLSGSWRKDAATSVVSPRNRRSLETMINLLPGVLANSTGNPLDSREMDSDLARFLGGFAVTYDELLTWIDILLPASSRSDGVVRGLHESLARSVGMPVEYTVGIASSSRLYRNSGSIYRKKGLVDGVQEFVESLTGWSARVSDSTNLMKSLDDASFEGSTGSWNCTGGSLVPLQVNETTVTTPTLAHDYELWPFAKNYVGSVTVGETGTTVLELPLLVGHGAGTDFGTGRVAADRTACIPVLGNRDYTLSAYARDATDTGLASATLAVEWLDSAGTPIEVTEGSSQDIPGEWQRLERSLASPETAAFAKLQIEINGEEDTEIHLDQMQFSLSSAEYHEPRTVNIVFDPKRVNLLSDPSFNAEINWTAVDGTIARTTADSALGDSSAVIDGSPFEVVSESVPAREEQVMTFSVYIKGDPATVSLEFVSATGTVVDTASPTSQLSSPYVQEVTTGSLDDWERISVSGLTPALSKTIRIRIVGDGTTYIDAALLERSDAAKVFFDSLTADQDGEDAKLVSYDGHEYSVLYPGWLTKLSRLKTTLPYYLAPTVKFRVILWDADDPEVTDYLPYGVGSGGLAERVSILEDRMSLLRQITDWGEITGLPEVSADLETRIEILETLMTALQEAVEWYVPDPIETADTPLEQRVLDLEFLMTALKESTVFDAD